MDQLEITVMEFSASLSSAGSRWAGHQWDVDWSPALSDLTSLTLMEGSPSKQQSPHVLPVPMEHSGRGWSPSARGLSPWTTNKSGLISRHISIRGTQGCNSRPLVYSACYPPSRMGSRPERPSLSVVETCLQSWYPRESLRFPGVALADVFINLFFDNYRGSPLRSWELGGKSALIGDPGDGEIGQHLAGGRPSEAEAWQPAARSCALVSLCGCLLSADCSYRLSHV